MDKNNLIANNAKPSMMKFNPLALLGGIGTLIGNVGGSLLNNYFNRKQIKDMNLYNSPAEQIKRFREAGLSASMMYNSQGSAGLQTGTATGAFAGDMGVGQAFNAYQTLAMQQKQEAILSQDAAIRQNDRAVSDAETYEKLVDRGSYDAEGNWVSSGSYTQQQFRAENTLRNLTANITRLDYELLSDPDVSAARKRTYILDNWSKYHGNRVTEQTAKNLIRENEILDRLQKELGSEGYGLFQLIISLLK